MRALKSITRIAGIIKRKSTESELNCMVMAIRASTCAAFTQDDMAKAEYIFIEHFDGAKPFLSGEDAIAMEKIKTLCAQRGLEASDAFIKKCFNIHVMTQIRHGIAVMDNSFEASNAMNLVCTGLNGGEMTYIND